MQNSATNPVRTLCMSEWVNQIEVGVGWKNLKFALNAVCYCALLDRSLQYQIYVQIRVSLPVLAGRMWNPHQQRQLYWGMTILREPLTSSKVTSGYSPSAGYIWILTQCRIHLDTHPVQDTSGYSPSAGYIWMLTQCRIHLDTHPVRDTSGYSPSA